MKILKIDPKKPETSTIKKAVEVLESGSLLVYPTDTAYGLGVNALDEDAVRKLYNVKFRDYSKPTHVVVRDWKMIEALCEPNNLSKKLYDEFLPGPLTLILSKTKKVPDILTGNLPTVGVRIPKNLITQSLSRLISFPYTTPSANKAGGKTPYSIEEVKKTLDLSKIDLILDAGKLPTTPPSTVIDLSTTSPKILREGSISKIKISNILEDVSL